MAALSSTLSGTSIALRALAPALDKLAAGLKVDRGTDAPASLVASEIERAQAAQLQNALGATTEAVDMAATGQNALESVNLLLAKTRALALESADTTTSADALAANQADVQNKVASIAKIAESFQSAGQAASAKSGGSAAAARAFAAYFETMSDEIAELSTIDLAAEGGGQKAVEIVDKTLAELARIRADADAASPGVVTQATDETSAAEATTSEEVAGDEAFVASLSIAKRMPVALSALGL